MPPFCPHKSQRPLPIIRPAAVHGPASVMGRGDHGEAISRDHRDRVRFLEALEEVPTWRLRRRTVVGSGWMAERLRMGHPTRVTWAVGRVRQAERRKILQLSD